MVNGNIRKEIENVLKRSRKPLTESDISKRTGIDYWDVVKVVDSFKRRGLVETVKWQRK